MIKKNVNCIIDKLLWNNVLIPSQCLYVVEDKIFEEQPHITTQQEVLTVNDNLFANDVGSNYKIEDNKSEISVSNESAIIGEKGIKKLFKESTRKINRQFHKSRHMQRNKTNRKKNALKQIHAKPRNAKITVPENYLKNNGLKFSSLRKESFNLLYLESRN